MINARPPAIPASLAALVTLLGLGLMYWSLTGLGLLRAASAPVGGTGGTGMAPAPVSKIGKVGMPGQPSKTGAPSSGGGAGGGF